MFGSHHPRRHRARAFTFLEIMLVVVIIGILASMVIPRFAGRVGKAKEVKARNDIKAISLALGAYEMEVGSFPSTEQGLEALVTRPSNVSEEDWTQQLPEVPLDPWKNEYIYKCPGEHGDFDLICKGKDGKEGTEDDINNFPKKRTRR